MCRHRKHHIESTQCDKTNQFAWGKNSTSEFNKNYSWQENNWLYCHFSRLPLKFIGMCSQSCRHRTDVKCWCEKNSHFARCLIILHKTMLSAISRSFSYVDYTVVHVQIHSFNPWSHTHTHTHL